MIRQLRQILESAAFRQELAERARGRPAGTPVSVSLPLAARHDDWLALLPQGNTPFWYWARQGEYRLGLGHALAADSAGPQRFAELGRVCRAFAQPEGAAGAFVGFAFDGATAGALPNARLAIPALQLVSGQGQGRVVFTAQAGHLPAAYLTWLACLAAPAAPAPLPAVRRLPAAGADRDWLARVDAALAAIAAGELEKVVLARRTSLVAESPIPAAPLLAALVARQPGSTVYAHGQGGSVFLGATPETLVSLDGGRVLADALAGTAWPGSQQLKADKNRREQALVAEAVSRALAPLCRRLAACPAPQALQVGPLSHLRSRIEGEALPGTGLLDLAAALHPTPAVGGSPTPAALSWLERNGEERLGWYSGGIGCLDANGGGEIAVALRCALITGHRAELQAGAGIVAGSCPRQELAETEAKLATLLDALAEPARQAMTETC